MSHLINIEITLALFLILLQWHQLAVPKPLCCKDNSRLVRKIVQSKWTPTFDKYKVKVPIQCPLNSFRDIYEPREKSKEKHRLSQWTCKKCGKNFYEEKYLDMHFEKRHQNVINNAEDAICLADFCDIMRCDVLSSDSAITPFGVPEKVTDVEIWADISSPSPTLIPFPSTPFPAKSSDNKRKSLLIPKTDSSVKRDIHLNNFYGRKLCQQDREKKHASNRREQTNEFPDDDYKRQEPADNKAQFLYQQKPKNNCKPEELLKTKMKCESLVHTCMAGLLLEMSDHAFKEMEDELNKAVCWYLTCERYWDGETIKTRLFPWGLMLAIVIILSLGICFCYYIIWILFDSGDNSFHVVSNSSYSSKYSQRQIDIARSNGQQLKYDSDISKYNDNTSPYQVDTVDLTNNEHFIYVTYPPELKARLVENYE